MKYTVMSSLTFTTPAQADTLHNGFLAKIAGKPTWGKSLITKSTGQDGKPAHGMEIRFENAPDMQELFQFVKDKMIQLPVLKGKVSIHKCLHDTPGEDKGCVILNEYVREEK